MLRDLNVALVAEHMIAGAPVIFVDFVDYDEIAHHAGVARRESLDSLAGIDQVLGTLEKVAAAAPRDYRIVVLSDHGQSQGPTFRQLTGHTLEDAVRKHMGTPAAATLTGTDDVELWGPLNAMLTEVLSASKPTARLAQRWAGGADGTGVLVGPHRGDPAAPATERGDGVPSADERPELVVVGSGNLGLVWLPRMPGKVRIEELNVRFPTLVAGLLAEPGVGFVVADSARGPLALGPQGVHVLLEGVVEGVDPLAPFGRRAAADLARVAAMDIAPDLYVHSTLDARTGRCTRSRSSSAATAGSGDGRTRPPRSSRGLAAGPRPARRTASRAKRCCTGPRPCTASSSAGWSAAGARAVRAADRGRSRRRTARPDRLRVDERGEPLRGRCASRRNRSGPCQGVRVSDKHLHSKLIDDGTPMGCRRRVRASMIAVRVDFSGLTGTSMSPRHQRRVVPRAR
jgi:hypothetical protein